MDHDSKASPVKLAVGLGIPFSALRPARNAQPGTINSNSEIKMSIGRQLKVLVAEDNIINQRIAREMLAELGHTGVIVGDGEKALKCMEKLQFDFVLMDVMMPNMDGMQALAAIRDKEQRGGRKTPVIMATAHTEPGEAGKMKRAGADGYVPKPLETNALAAEIQRVIG
jgi:CheY-like chemotaxis protein